jgi:hypothetical protein
MIEAQSKQFVKPSGNEAKLFAKPIKSLLYGVSHIIRVPCKGC